MDFLERNGPGEPTRGQTRECCSVGIAAPPAEVYALWQCYEQLPRIVDGVRRVKRVNGRRTLWEADIAGRQVVWEAEVTAVEPSKRIAWESRSGPAHTGEIRFIATADSGTRMEVDIALEPSGILERLAVKLRLVRHQIANDLALFRRFAESNEARSPATPGALACAAGAPPLPKGAR